MQVDMQNKDGNIMNLLEEAACPGSDSACSCRLVLQKIDCLEASLGDIKNVSFQLMINSLLKLSQGNPKCLGNIFANTYTCSRKSRHWKMHFRTPKW